MSISFMIILCKARHLHFAYKNNFALNGVTADIVEIFRMTDNIELFDLFRFVAIHTYG